MRIALVVLLFVAATSVQAQAPEASVDSVCTYERCAIRLEPGVLGVKIVRGPIDNPEVAGDVGLFESDLAAVVASSPAARDYALESDRQRSRVLIGSAVYGGGLAVALMPQGVVGQEIRLGAALLSLGGALYLLLSRPAQKASRAQSRAIWEYNGSLSR